MSSNETSIRATRSMIHFECLGALGQLAQQTFLTCMLAPYGSWCVCVCVCVGGVDAWGSHVLLHAYTKGPQHFHTHPQHPSSPQTAYIAPQTHTIWLRIIAVVVVCVCVCVCVWWSSFKGVSSIRRPLSDPSAMDSRPRNRECEP